MPKAPAVPPRAAAGKRARAGPAERPTKRARSDAPAAGVDPAAVPDSTPLESIKLVSVGPATRADFAVLGLRTVGDLRASQHVALYERLCAATGERHDPCVLDVFQAAIAQVTTHGERRAWWHYSAQRRAAHGGGAGEASRARAKKARGKPGAR